MNSDSTTVRYIRIHNYVFNIYKILSIHKKTIKPLFYGNSDFILKIDYSGYDLKTSMGPLIKNIETYEIKYDNEEIGNQNLEIIKTILSKRNMITL